MKTFTYNNGAKEINSVSFDSAYRTELQAICVENYANKYFEITHRITESRVDDKELNVTFILFNDDTVTAKIVYIDSKFVVVCTRNLNVQYKERSFNDFESAESHLFFVLDMMLFNANNNLQSELKSLYKSEEPTTLTEQPIQPEQPGATQPTQPTQPTQSEHDTDDTHVREYKGIVNAMTSHCNTKIQIAIFMLAVSVSLFILSMCFHLEGIYTSIAYILASVTPLTALVSVFVIEYYTHRIDQMNRIANNHICKYYPNTYTAKRIALSRELRANCIAR